MSWNVQLHYLNIPTKDLIVAFTDVIHTLNALKSWIVLQWKLWIENWMVQENKNFCLNVKLERFRNKNVMFPSIRYSLHCVKCQVHFILYFSIYFHLKSLKPWDEIDAGMQNANSKWLNQKLTNGENTIKNKKKMATMKKATTKTLNIKWIIICMVVCFELNTNIFRLLLLLSLLSEQKFFFVWLIHNSLWNCLSHHCCVVVALF